MMRPDFQQPITFGEGCTIFYPFEGRGSYVCTPDRLQVAMLASGRPDFRLQFYRGQNPMMPPEPYGVLDMHLDLHYPLELALMRLRERHPDAQLEPATIIGGYMRLLAPGAVDFPDEADRPVPLTGYGLMNTRFQQRLSFEGAQFLKGLLQNESLPMLAQVEFEVAGVAPRLPVRVRFDPARLHPALLALADDVGRIARNTLVSFFTGDLALHGLELEGETIHPGELAETLTDWVRARYGTFVASPHADGRGNLALNLPDLGTGRVEWDLSQPLETWRPLVLTLRPLDAARQAVRVAGMDAIVPPQIIVPPLPTGIFQVEVSTNIPEVRPGVLALGVTLRAKPRPPSRPQAVTSSAELVPPADMAIVQLTLSPTEPLEYTYSTFVILEDSRGIRQFDGPEVAGSSDQLYLTPDDFPVRFVPLAANKALLDLATVHGRCCWMEEGTAVSLAFDLDHDRPELAIPIPAKANETTIEFEVRARDGERSLKIGPFPARPQLLGLHTFSEYGPHQVIIELAEMSTAELVALDLLPEDRPETAEAMTVLALTPSQPRKTWTYFASSPFRSGYQFRRHAGINGVPGPWSEVQSPFENLVLDPERL